MKKEVVEETEGRNAVELEVKENMRQSNVQQLSKVVFWGFDNHRDRHACPTRRSDDLGGGVEWGWSGVGVEWSSLNESKGDIA